MIKKAALIVLLLGVIVMNLIAAMLTSEVAHDAYVAEVMWSATLLAWATLNLLCGSALLILFIARSGHWG